MADIAPGLADSEFERIEATFGAEFADDHRASYCQRLLLGDIKGRTGVDQSIELQGVAAVVRRG